MIIKIARDLRLSLCQILGKLQKLNDDNQGAKHTMAIAATSFWPHFGMHPRDIDRQSVSCSRKDRTKISCKSCVYPDTSWLLRCPKLYLPSHYWRDSRETDSCYQTLFTIGLATEKNAITPAILIHLLLGNDVSLVTYITVFGVMCKL